MGQGQTDLLSSFWVEKRRGEERGGRKRGREGGREKGRERESERQVERPQIFPFVLDSP